MRGAEGQGANAPQRKWMCRMLLAGCFTLVYVPTEVEGRRNGLCGAVWAAATCLTWSAFASAGGSDSENRWDRSLRLDRPVSSTTLAGPDDQDPVETEGLRPPLRPFLFYQEHMLWLL
jgi:hypothetical protein